MKVSMLYVVYDDCMPILHYQDELEQWTVVPCVAL